MTRQATPQHLLFQLLFRSAVNTWTTAEDKVCGDTEREGGVTCVEVLKKRILSRDRFKDV